jgi:integrase
VIFEPARRRSLTLATEAEARRLAREFASDLALPENRSVEAMIAMYTRARITGGEVTAQTGLDQDGILRRFLARFLRMDLTAVSSRQAAALYRGAVDGEVTGQAGERLSAATHRLYLAVAKGFFAWAKSKGYVAANPFQDVQPVGRPNTGKAQLRIGEARRFIAAGLALYEEKRTPLAIAAVMALTMGLRANELMRRRVRDVDDDASVLWIDAGKTHNARRHPTIPPFLRPYVRQILADRLADAPLFPFARKPDQANRRQRLNVMVHAICRRAGVPLVCPHSLRGLYATLAVESGAVSDAVAASLGHSSFAMTAKHYAQPSAVANARTSRVLDVLGHSSAERAVQSLSAEELAALLTPQQRERLLAVLLYDQAKGTPT